MTIINVRDILSYPGGSNETDTVIAGIHFNLTTLNYWNYTLYTNGTLSNGSRCFLTFEPYTPRLLMNGTFLNTTSCFVPIKELGMRAKPGIAFGIFFGLSLVFTMINLRKHGRLFLPSQARFRAVGRRWMWYWMLWIGGCGMASGFMSVDVDRYYLPEWPLMLNVIFWYMCVPSTLAVVWESVRHWGSWEERQMIDPDPFSLPQDDRRGTAEFYMPLAFYTFAFFSFFMAVPRNWKPIALQRSPEQTEQFAKPAGQDGRFKASAFFLFFAWLVILYCVRHNIHHYKPRNRGVLNSIIGGIRYTPLRYRIVLPLSLLMCAYQFAIYWDWSISPMNQHGEPGFIYGLGWGPIALILITFIVSGYLLPNEDRELIRQRRVRGQEIDAEMGYTKKPNWWRLLHHEQGLTVQEALSKRAREVGGRLVGSMTAEQVEAEERAQRGTELQDLSARKRNEDRVVRDTNTPAFKASARAEQRRAKEEHDDFIRRASTALFPGAGSSAPGLQRRPTDTQYLMSDDLMDGNRGRKQSAAASGASDSTSDARPRSVATGNSARTSVVSIGSTLNQPPQQIRSMLDI